MIWPTDYLNKVLCGDCLDVLLAMPDETVNCCITSPPYWGLRDYGVDGQLGLEKTPEQYVSRMVDVFREVRRVLKDDGTLWINLGDSYSGSCQTGGTNSISGTGKSQPHVIHTRETNLKPKDLVGIPWMVAFALRSDGWYLRQDIIWAKPNPMPESVTDRCTKAHEYIFLLSKQAKYYYDAEAISEPLQESSITRNQTGWDGNEDRGYVGGPQNHMSKYLGSDVAKSATHRNRRSVWTVTTKPFREAHFATFPPDLIEPCALAGCPEGGIILDPFMGAGTTAVVAKTNHRNFIGIELNPAYIGMANQRIDGTLVNRKLNFQEARP